MARFADLADIIRVRIGVDEAFHDLCEDYGLACETLTRIKREKPRPTKQVAEYTALVEELENEIIRSVLGSERPKRR